RTVMAVRRPTLWRCSCESTFTAGGVKAPGARTKNRGRFRYHWLRPGNDEAADSAQGSVRPHSTNQESPLVYVPRWKRPSNLHQSSIAAANRFGSENPTGFWCELSKSVGFSSRPDARIGVKRHDGSSSQLW